MAHIQQAFMLISVLCTGHLTLSNLKIFSHNIKPFHDQRVCLRTGLTVYKTLNACQPGHFESVLIPQTRQIIQCGLLIVILCLRLKLEMPLLRKLFRLLLSRFTRLYHFILSTSVTSFKLLLHHRLSLCRFVLVHHLCLP